MIFVPAPTLVPAGTMMERLARGQYVPYGSPMCRTALKNFIANLENLNAMAIEYHVPLIFGTQVSNLRDLPPFISGVPPGISATEKARLAAIVRDSAHFQDTILAPVHAALRFSLARDLDRSGQYPEARRQYRLARDYDELRFRCSSDFNDAIRHFGNLPGTRVVDFEEVFALQSPDSNVGRTLITEHLHPNARGYFLMAKAYAAAMRAGGLLASDEEWTKRDTVSDELLWAERPLTDLDSLCAEKRTRLLTAGWPFRDSTIAESPIGSDELSRIAEKMVRGVFTWEEGHVAAAEAYEAAGEIRLAAREYRSLINQLPLNVSPYLRPGRLYAQAGYPDSAETVLQRSLNLERTSFALRSLGAIFVTRGRYADATRLLNDAIPLCPTTQEIADTRYLLALAWARAGYRQQALLELDRLFAVAPGHTVGQRLEELMRGRQ